MDKREFDVDFYDLADGTKPAEAFIEWLSPEIERAKKYRAEYLSREENKQ